MKPRSIRRCRTRRRVHSAPCGMGSPTRMAVRGFRTVSTTLFCRGVGFSYQLDPNTVIRGGFGIYAYNWSNDTYNGASQGPIMGGAFGVEGQC